MAIFRLSSGIRITPYRGKNPFHTNHWFAFMYQLFPLRTAKPPIPTTSYTEACARLAQIQAAERVLADGELLEHCATQLLDHGDMTEHVLVLLHGFTNCPHQFHQLAPLLHQQGYTVLLPRLSRHGYRNRLTDAPAALTIEELVNDVTAAVDIAHGLGRNVTVLGFSLGGILAAWLAQERADLYQVILVSPALGIQALSPWRSRVAGHLLAMLPNFFQWWSPELKDKPVGPLHAYPRFSSRGLAALLRLGGLVVAQARQRKPATSTITAIDNPHDPVIDHKTFAHTVANWRNHGVRVTTHEFPADWQLIHDFIDPHQEQQQVERVYPLLLTWIEEGIQQKSDIL